MSYFVEIASSLSLDDMKILGILHDGEANAKFKSVRNTTLFRESQLTESRYRKTISKLIALKLIYVDNTNKEHNLYVSEYGVDALHIAIG